MDISIIVPLYNEAESLPSLYEWIVRVMNEHKFIRRSRSVFCQRQRSVFCQ